jgi:transposase
MPALAVLPDPKLLRLDRLTPSPDALTLEVSAIQPKATCPACATPSRHIHSRYGRSLGDLPWQGVPVRVSLQVRRFFCISPSCPRQIFVERLPTVAAPYGRQTLRADLLVRALAFALGGEPGARLADRIQLRVSPDTLLRRIRSTPVPESQTPRVLGVDDFALRRGQRYGTLLVDLERHEVIDLLEERSAESFAAWLAEHPGVEILSRDRGEQYSEGGRRGAPDAQHVADRFHLIKNSNEALERFLATHQADLAEAAAAATAELREAASAVSQTAPDPAAEPARVPAPVAEPRPRTRAERERAERRASRLARYERVIELWRKGLSKHAIARETGLNRETVQVYISAGAFPEISSHGPRRSGLDPFVPYLQQRWADGCRNATRLFEELRGLGYTGTLRTLRRRVRTWRGHDGRGRWKHDAGAGPPPVDPIKPPSPRRATWLLVGDTDRLDARDVALRNHLLGVGGIRDATTLALEFHEIVRTRGLDAFADWLERAKSCAIAEMESFAKGLEQDRSAVEAALRLEWSNGQLEGQISKLKTLKRSMYGRAKPDLLRARMLHGP